jgi:hypothetical protein
MSGETWSPVASVATTWNDASGYVFTDYYTDESYAIGHEPSAPSWAASSGDATSWVCGTPTAANRYVRSGYVNTLYSSES